MSGATLRPVLLDNYDSYTFNLYQLLGELSGVEPRVVRNDRVTVAEVIGLCPTHLVVSPGPGRADDPAYFGVCRAVILELGATTPLLGVCLGHQGIADAFGGRIVRAVRPRHGKTSPVLHDGAGIFRGLESPLEAMRYHSLVVERASLPEALRVTATSGDDGEIMALAHRSWPLVGLQFHPESIGTRAGRALLANFLAVTGPGGSGATPR